MLQKAGTKNRKTTALLTRHTYNADGRCELPAASPQLTVHRVRWQTFREPAMQTKPDITKRYMDPSFPGDPYIPLWSVEYVALSRQEPLSVPIRPNLRTRRSIHYHNLLHETSPRDNNASRHPVSRSSSSPQRCGQRSSSVPATRRESNLLHWR
jgi:hypothetical protein